MPPRSHRLLLVEDNPADARVVREYVKEAKGEVFTVEVAGRLSPALERLAVAQFDVALVDLSLPDSHGLDTFERLRAEAPRLPIIALTGLEDEEMALKAIHTGAQDYLTKRTLNSESLVRSVRYAMGRADMTRALELNAIAL